MTTACPISPATPRFSRDAWTKHENFPGHLLLLGSHNNFLSISKTLVTRARVLDGEPTPLWRADTRYLFDWWQRGMKNHERYEENKLYPFLSDRYCVSLGVLVGDHGEIDDLRERVTVALVDGDAAAVRHELDAFHTTLMRHLRDEEDLVIPMLLDLEPDEFRNYSVGRPSSSSCDCR